MRLYCQALSAPCKMSLTRKTWTRYIDSVGKVLTTVKVLANVPQAYDLQ